MPLTFLTRLLLPQSSGPETKRQRLNDTLTLLRNRERPGVKGTDLSFLRQTPLETVRPRMTGVRGRPDRPFPLSIRPTLSQRPLSSSSPRKDPDYLRPLVGTSPLCPAAPPPRRHQSSTQVLSVNPNLGPTRQMNDPLKPVRRIGETQTKE